MARSRNIKPGFFLNEHLAELPFETRLLFIGLWCLADREGRLEDRPAKIRVGLFPYDNVNVDSMLTELESKLFVHRYEIDGIKVIEIENFVKHQDPHYREKASELPPRPGKGDQIKATNVTRTQRQRILERDGYACCSCGSEDNLCIDHIIPASRGGGSEDDNLQVLCLSCNTKKGNKLAGEDKNKTRPPQEQLPPNLDGQFINNQVRLDVEVRRSPSVSLIPDSLNLIPDPLIPDPPTTGDAGGHEQDLFVRFWIEYPRKDAKVAAQKAWKRLKVTDDLFAQIMSGLARAKRSKDWIKDSGQFIPLPATWINGRRWEDQGPGGPDGAPKTFRSGDI
jgi:5-methylcytosine-specific restriction endonuclease McrA